MKKTGRRSAYEEKILPRFEEIKKWIQAGNTEKSIAKQLGISYATFNKYKTLKIEFTEVLKKGRETAVDELENALYESALGGIQRLQKCMKVKRIEYKEGKKIAEIEEVVPYIEEVYIPSNTTAGIYLLKHWGRSKGYTNDPEMLDIKKEELKLQKAKQEKEDW